MRVIIGIDDSPGSEAVMKWVEKERWPEGTRFTIVSAAGIPAYALVEPGGTSVYARLEQDQLKAHEKLAARARKQLEQAGFAVTTRVELEDARRAILGEAEIEKADLVVVGSHGRTGLPKLLMGSVASHVVAHAPCNVLVVKRPEDRATSGRSVA